MAAYDRATARSDERMQLQHLQATVKDVVDCLQDIQKQVEMLRQHILYFRSQEEKQTLLDAEIQTLKGAVQSLQGRRRGTAAQQKQEFLKIRVLVRELDAQKADILNVQQTELRDLRTKVETLEQSGIRAVQDDSKAAARARSRSPGNVAKAYGTANATKAAVAQALAVSVEGVSSMTVSRQELLDAVFRAIDEDLSGALNSKEMRVFAKLGWPEYEYDDATWEAEYEEEARENGLDVAVGCPRKIFEEMVNDKDSDYYCTDDRLNKIAAKLLLLPDPEVDEEAAGAASDASDTREAEAINAKLLEAIESGDERFAVAVVAKSNMAEVNEMDNNGCSALHNSAQQGQLQVCRALLARDDFDYPNAKDWTFGATALHVAAQYGQVEICKALLEAPRFTEANGKNCDGATALHIAARNGHAEVCQALLDSLDFTETGAQTFDGYTALHTAAINAHAEVCRVLVAHGRFQSEDARSELGTTALEIAQGEARVTLHRLLGPQSAAVVSKKPLEGAAASDIAGAGGIGGTNPLFATSQATSGFTVGRADSGNKTASSLALTPATDTKAPAAKTMPKRPLPYVPPFK